MLLCGKVEDRVQLNVAGALVNSTDLTVTPVLLNTLLASEANATEPFDSTARGTLSCLARIQLGHSGLLREGTALFLQTSSVVYHQTGSLDLSGNLRHLELQALELGDRLGELLTVVRVSQSTVKGTLR